MLRFLPLTLTLVLSPRATAQPDFDSQGEIRESAALSPADRGESSR